MSSSGSCSSSASFASGGRPPSRGAREYRPPHARPFSASAAAARNQGAQRPFSAGTGWQAKSRDCELCPREPHPAYFERPRTTPAPPEAPPSVTGMVQARACSERQRRSYNSHGLPLPVEYDHGRTLRLGDRGYKRIQDTLPNVKPAGMATHWSGRTGALKRRYNHNKNTPGGSVREE
mmetsp:Transcript_50080/g.113856  ORF Transcript_50080/g.113856 Transcript_50080/m.113856 type:complete len:178 (+) Transcript_50080:31-564(+)|eukprot:CAMPEP_0204270944 /NCGR_PEP_ID=MMETSP0468-20130131/19182_1 /ASSEMBLY_ACC=CAM_ASM_000383 /TAXON_ID=2969 /ORGANISM="Oxyrrhis marina" /LENGTH=177 /DNA_ID=CAMNT_0051246543 /DNA_START=30 /DNA_END=563 /DNA_ORIENTATION=+